MAETGILRLFQNLKMMVTIKIIVVINIYNVNVKGGLEAALCHIRQGGDKQEICF